MADRPRKGVQKRKSPSHKSKIGKSLRGRGKSVEHRMATARARRGQPAIVEAPKAKPAAPPPDENVFRRELAEAVERWNAWWPGRVEALNLTDVEVADSLFVEVLREVVEAEWDGLEYGRDHPAADVEKKLRLVEIRGVPNVYGCDSAARARTAEEREECLRRGRRIVARIRELRREDR